MRRDILIDNESSGWLLGFSTSYSFTDDGKMYPLATAIVEMLDGTIKQIQPHRLKFVDYNRVIREHVFFNHFNKVKIISSLEMSNHLKGIELLSDGMYVSVKKDIYYALAVIFKENFTKKFDKLGDAMLWVCTLKI